MLISTFKLFAQSELHSHNSWVPDYLVNDIMYSNGYTLLTGNFSEVGQYTGSSALVDRASADVEDMPKITGVLYTSVADGEGGWYIGGYFQYVDTVKISNLAHIKKDKTVDRNWKPNPNGSIYAMAIEGSTLYAGGGFTFINGNIRNYIASFNITNGSLTAWNPDAQSVIQIIKPTTDIVYVGGFFTKIGGKNRTAVAALNSTNATATNWAPVISNGAVVNALLVDEASKTLFIGGNFSAAGGQARQGLAQLRTDVTGGTATTWKADINVGGTISDIVKADNVLYVAGNFTTLEGASRKSVGAISATGTGDVLTTWNAQLDNAASVEALTISGDTLYIGGNLTSAKTLPREGVAALKLTTAAILDWAPTTNGTVNTLSVSGNKIFLGGNFRILNRIVSNDFVLFNEATRKPWPFTFDLNKGYKIKTIAVTNGKLYIGGIFNSVNKEPRDNLAAFDLSTGELLPWNPSVTTPDGTAEVNTMKVKNNLLYIGGSFFLVNEEERPSLAALSLDTGKPGKWNPIVGSGKFVEGVVNSMDVIEDKIYIAGLFNLVGGNQPRTSLAVVDANTSAVSPWAPECEGEVQKICVAQNAAYVLGEFSDGVGGKFPNDNVAALDLDKGLNTGWNPTFDGDDVINDIAITPTDVYVGGEFTKVFIGKDINDRPGLASFSLASGVLNNWTPDLRDDDVTPYVNALATSYSNILVGGTFNRLGYDEHGYYAEYSYCAPRPVIAINQSTLTTTASFNNYQWYNGDDIIEGANAQSLEILTYEYGVYSVAVSEFGCTTRSDNFVYLITSDNLTQEANSINVFPNPVKDGIFVEVPEQATYSLMDMMGRNISNGVLLKQHTNTIETRHLISGAYILSIRFNNNTYHYKILKTQ